MYIRVNLVGVAVRAWPFVYWRVREDQYLESAERACAQGSRSAWRYLFDAFIFKSNKPLDNSGFIKSI